MARFFSQCLSLLAGVLIAVGEAQNPTQRNFTFNYYDMNGGNISTNLLVDYTMNPISAPTANEIIPAGKDYVIRWTSTVTTGVSFDLCHLVQDELYLYYLADGTRHTISMGVNEPDSGSYTWAVSSQIQSGDDYVVVAYSEGGTRAALSPVFKISNPDYVAPSSSNKASTVVTTSSQPASTMQEPSSTLSLSTNTNTPTASQTSTLLSQSQSPSSSVGASSSPSSASNKSSTKVAVVGGAVGGVLGALVIILILIVSMLFRTRKKREANFTDVVTSVKPELDASEKEKNIPAELEGGSKNRSGAELEARGAVHELQ